MTILLLMFGGAAVAVAGIRIEQARCAFRIQQHKLRQIELQRLLHEQQLEIARLRSPAVVRSRIAYMNLNVEPPAFQPARDSDQPFDGLVWSQSRRAGDAGQE